MIISYPNFYYHGRKYLRWQDAMDEEFNSLQKNATWELVSLNASGCFRKRLVLMEKYKSKNKFWLQKDSHRSKDWTIMRPLHRWQRWTQLDLFWSFPHPSTGRRIIWMIRVNFSMEKFMSRYT